MDDLDLLGFVAQLVIVLRVVYEDDRTPCQDFYFEGGPHGWREPVRVCACKYPDWTVYEMRAVEEDG